MKCPFCNYAESKVVDSRPVEESNSIRRRRECLQCGKRFTTYEVIETVQIVVIKKDGSKEFFDPHKILSGVRKATEKRPVDAQEITNEVEQELQNSLRQEITSTEIGEIVMRKLKARDDVSYVRFASVYREFTDIDTFLEELRSLKKKHRKI
ncbi:MAG: transcriptional repressor NrdR [Clostridia bacterium]|nr:transcriptional repressor NrdR [Clostridia bacterium]